MCVCVCVCVVSIVQKTVPALLLLSHVHSLAAAANEFETSTPLCGDTGTSIRSGKLFNIHSFMIVVTAVMTVAEVASDFLVLSHLV